jgi:hypothetical protein
MPHFEQHFTLAQARALLPELRRAFARIHALLEEIQKKRGEQQHEDSSSGSGGGVQFFSANGHGPRVVGGDEGRLLEEIQTILNGINDKGIQVKDLRRGLCDFPHLLPPTQEEVFLCWELSESDIGYWHSIEGGYSGRVRLDA